MAIRGVFAAAATPLGLDLRPDPGAAARHCAALIAAGCHGVAPLGTTGEATSLSMDERMAVLEAIAHAVPPQAIIAGTGLANAPETIALTRHALTLGITQVLMLPPFYYKGVSDDGLFAHYAQVIEGVADDRLRVVLYHFPQMSAVPLSLDLIGRLIAAFPGIIAGIKDSSGEIDNIRAMVRAFDGFAVLSGADPALLPLMQAGGAGCITALANLAAGDLRAIHDGWNDPAASARVAAAQARLEALRALAQSAGGLAFVKAELAQRADDPGWARVRPPLLTLDSARAADALARLDAINREHPPARQPG